MFRDVIVSIEEVSAFQFGFLGEFGYELISWTPYVWFLNQKFGLRPQIVGRAGGQIFYPQAASYLEIPDDLFSNRFGHVESYLSLYRLLKTWGFGNVSVVHPLTEWPERSIEISGCPWEVKDIHTDIRSDFYRPVEIKDFAIEMPFHTRRPIIVINNKTYSQMHGAVNVYRGRELEELRDFLNSLGYFLVYNCFFDKYLDNFSERVDLEDHGIFGRDDRSFDMREFYSTERSALKRNKVQAMMFKQAELVLGTQGGNAYMPAICGCDQFLLVRGGIYKDYTELARIYGTDIQCFYEVAHFFPFLQKRLTLGDRGID